MLNCLGPSDIVLQCDPEPSAQKVWNRNVKNEQSSDVLQIEATEQWKTIRNSSIDKDVGSWACSSLPLTRGMNQAACQKIHFVSALSVVGLYCGSLVDLCLLIFLRWEKDLGLPHRSWPTGGNPPRGWAKATSQRNIWSERVTNRRAQLARRKPSSNCRKHHRNPSRRHWTSLLQLTLLLLHVQHQKCMKTRRRNPQRSQRKTKRCRWSQQTQR